MQYGRNALMVRRACSTLQLREIRRQAMTPYHPGTMAMHGLVIPIGTRTRRRVDMKNPPKDDGDDRNKCNGRGGAQNTEPRRQEVRTTRIGSDQTGL